MINIPKIVLLNLWPSHVMLSSKFISRYFHICPWLILHNLHLHIKSHTMTPHFPRPHKLKPFHLLCWDCRKRGVFLKEEFDHVPNFLMVVFVLLTCCCFLPYIFSSCKQKSDHKAPDPQISICSQRVTVLYLRIITLGWFFFLVFHKG